MSDASKRKEKQKWTIEKPKLDNAGKLRGIYFIDPDDEEFKDITKNARRKLEVPMPAALLCKSTVGEHKTKIASALKKIIHNSYFKKKVSLEEQKAPQKDRFLRGRQIAFMIHDYFRVTGAHDTVLDYADLFSVTLRNDDVQEFDTRWDENFSIK